MTKFPELTDDQNQIIENARQLGFSGYFPAYPTAQHQAVWTLSAAKEFLRRFHQSVEQGANQ